MGINCHEMPSRIHGIAPSGEIRPLIPRELPTILQVVERYIRSHTRPTIQRVITVKSPGLA